MSRAAWALCAIVLAEGCSPALDWREVRSDDSAVSLLFPCRPVRQQRSVALGGRPAALVLQVCDAGDASWALAWSDVGNPADLGPALKAMADGVHANLGAVAAAAVPHVVAGATPHPQSGRWRLQGRAPDGRSLEAATLVFARGTRVVQVSVLGPRLSAADVDTFLNSVRAAP